MSLIKPIQRSINNPTATAIDGASHSFAPRGAENAATRRLGTGSRRSAVLGSATLGAMVAMGALAYYIIRKVRHQERAFPPVGPLTVDDVSGPISHESETAVSATDAIATWPFAIAVEAIEYWQRSVDDSRAFLQRLTRVQELDDVIEIQSEFARRIYSNFITRPSKVVEPCSNMTREAFASYLSVKEANAKITHNEKDD